MAASPALTAASSETHNSAAAAWGSGPPSRGEHKAGGPAKPGQAPRPDIDQRLLAAWRRHRGLQASVRYTRRQATEARAEFAALLVEKRNSLTGTPTGFDAWLRLHHIPRSTAYHLIGFHLNGGSPKKIKPQTVSNLDTPSNTVQLDGQILSLRLVLTPRQAAVIAASLATLDQAQRQPGAKPLDLGELLATGLAASTAGPDRTRIQQLRRQPDASFSATVPPGLPPPASAHTPISTPRSSNFNHLPPNLSTNSRSSNPSQQLGH